MSLIATQTRPAGFDEWHTRLREDAERFGIDGCGTNLARLEYLVEKAREDESQHSTGTRQCEVCGKHLAQGFTDGDIYVCETHFEKFMGTEFGTWRQNDHEDDDYWDGGYYDAYDAREGKWYDTGMYWTEW